VIIKSSITEKTIIKMVLLLVGFDSNFNSGFNSDSGSRALLSELLISTGLV